MILTLVWDYVTQLSLVLGASFFILGCILCAVQPIRWKVWAKKERKKDKDYPHSDWYYSFDEWIEDHVPTTIGFYAIGIIMIIFAVVGTGCDGGTIYNNHVNEPARYEYAIVRAETLQDALAVSDDIVNTDLYSNVVAYNTQLANIKTKYNDPRYSFNFTGDYDWNALEYIDLIKKE